jgi:alkanesulfonate monooxygenase SsuD/methylene tetrahydromethanopterin reductase-like flavin-dependent oxidoreductase (luciferase family)
MAGVTKHVVIRENEQEAMKLARRAWRVFNEHWYATPLDAAIRPPGTAQIAGAVPDDFEQALADNTRLLIGTPATIKSFMERFVERFHDKPSVYFAPALQWGDMTQEEVLETMHLFASEVMPAFQPKAAAPKA